MRIIMGFVLACAVCGSWAADWSGMIVGVHDGDTLTVMHDGVGEKIRLDQIDAPELKQAFGQASKKSLSELCFDKQAMVNDLGKDKYGRTLGRVNCDGVDAGIEQVRRGLAWFYVEYGKDQAIKAKEDQARAMKAGLWADAEPMPPWDFRHGGTAKKGYEAGGADAIGSSGEFHTGPRGGCYTITSAGNKRYVSHDHCR